MGEAASVVFDSRGTGDGLLCPKVLVFFIAELHLIMAGRKLRLFLVVIDITLTGFVSAVGESVLPNWILRCRLSAYEPLFSWRLAEKLSRRLESVERIRGTPITPRIVLRVLKRLLSFIKELMSVFSF